MGAGHERSSAPKSFTPRVRASKVLVAKDTTKGRSRPDATPLDWTALAPYDDDKRVRAVIESPKGATTKIAYDPAVRAFSFVRALPLGLAYPYDWGFVPGTRAPDGDPVDILVVHDGATYPGVVVPCRLLGMVRATQRGNGLRRVTNHRVVAVPADHARLATVTTVPSRVKEEIERFFLAAVALEEKHVRIQGWDNARAAHALIRGARAQGSFPG
jgi:inorganic pyrophosphatase